MIDFLKAVLFGIVEGITEWLPISSTGHLIILNDFVKLNATENFMEMFDVVIQLGAIMAVVVLYFNKLWPFCIKKNETGFINRYCKKDTWVMWFKIIVATLPAVIGAIFDDKFNEWFFNVPTVAVMLILFGVLFIVVENAHRGKKPKVRSISEITFKMAFIIGCWQLIAAVLPGTSRSGATIIGALLLGIGRTPAAEFTFFLAIPAMFGASLLKLVKFGFAFSGNELMLLLVGMVTAFLVSLFVIRFLMSYIKKHNFKIFGWYRIALGIILLIYFAVKTATAA